MPATMKDVARKAGVSIKTVSRVINNQGEISDDTRQRIQSIINEIGYRPNSLARGLISGKTNSIALIIPDITDPFFPDVVLGVEHVAHSKGYSIFLCNTNEDPVLELDYINLLASKQVDGFIICGSRLSEEDLNRIGSLYPLSVLTSRKPTTTAVINIEGEEGLHEITSHLIKLGHKKIGHVGFQVADSGVRGHGYFRAMQEHNLPIQDSWVVYMPKVTIQYGREMTLQLFKQTRELTAITCYNDLAAIGALQALEELGIRVPEDVAVVGFDDLPLSSMISPKLTTMSVPRYELGELVAGLLLDIMETKKTPTEVRSIKPELVVRESCGAKLRAVEHY